MVPQDYCSHYNRSKWIVCLRALPQDQATTQTAWTACSCLSLGNKEKRAAITNSFGFGARYSLGNVKHMQQAVFLCRQLCLLPRKQSRALSNGPLCFIPSICYCTAHQPHPCQWYTSSNVRHCTFNHCLQFSAVALPLHACMHTYIYTYIPDNLLNLRIFGTVPERQGVGKEKTWSNFRQNRLFMTRSSRTNQHRVRSASLALEMASTSSEQPR